MIFFSLISTAFSSILYGFLATLALMFILYLALTAFSPTIKNQPAFYAVGGGLAVLLLVQLTLMIGAIQAKSYADDAALLVKQTVNGVYGTFDMSDSQKVMDLITDNYPVIGSYFNIADFSGATAADLPERAQTAINSVFSSYIWRRVWWALGMVVVGVAIVVFMDKPAKGGAGRSGGRSQRGGDRRPRTGTHQRVSRSRRH